MNRFADIARDLVRHYDDRSKVFIMERYIARFRAALDSPQGEMSPPPRYVYLAGPILGCTVESANGWRNYAANCLKSHNIIGVSPLRCEPIHGATYGAEYKEDPRFGSARAIAAKNKFDVRECDLTLAVLPNPEIGGRGSYGTLQEIAWADQAGRMVILVTDDPVVIAHPVIDSAPGWKLCAGKGQPYATIQDALTAGLEVCIGVLGGYTGGKNV